MLSVLQESKSSSTPFKNKNQQTATKHHVISNSCQNQEQKTTDIAIPDKVLINVQKNEAQHKQQVQKKVLASQIQEQKVMDLLPTSGHAIEIVTEDSVPGVTKLVTKLSREELIIENGQQRAELIKLRVENSLEIENLQLRNDQLVTENLQLRSENTNFRNKQNNKLDRLDDDDSPKEIPWSSITQTHENNLAPIAEQKIQVDDTNCNTNKKMCTSALDV